MADFRRFVGAEREDEPEVEFLVNLDLVTRVLPSSNTPGYCMIFLADGSKQPVRGDLKAIRGEIEKRSD